MTIEPPSDLKPTGQQTANVALVLGIISISIILVPLFLQAQFHLSAADPWGNILVLSMCLGSPGFSAAGVFTGLTGIRAATGKIRNRARIGLILSIIGSLMVLAFCGAYFYIFGVLRES